MINNPEATKRSRRVFIGNIHKNTQEIKIRKFVSKIMVNYGGIIQPGDPIDVSLFLPE